VLQILPFGVWLAAITSASLLAALWWLGELSQRSLAVSLAWFLLAGYCQFFGGSAIIGAIGLLLQTMLAIVLVIRWRFSG
jgi:hypothetical protein